MADVSEYNKRLEKVGTETLALLIGLKVDLLA
jgi:hypothetical protein